MLQNHHFANNQPQPSLEEVYVQRQKQQNNNLGILAPSQLPNHQPPPIPRVPELPQLSRGSQEPDQASFMSRTMPERPLQHQPPPMTAIDTKDRPQAYGFPTSDDQIEKISHSYDSYGRPVPARDEEEHTKTSEQEAADADGWDFDDPPSKPQPTDDAPPDYHPPRRADTDPFPSANDMSLRSSTRGPGSHRRKSSLSHRRQSDGSHEIRELSSSRSDASTRGDPGQFKVRFALRGHLDVVRSVIFTGGGSPSEPEICTCGDDGIIKRWYIPTSYGGFGPHSATTGSDLDLTSFFSHRGHSGAVLSLAASPASQNFSNGGRANGDGWVFSGGQDATVRVWERGRVDPKATLDGHTDAVWSVCVLPGTSASVLGDQCAHHGGPDRVVLASGGADGTILIWLSARHHKCPCRVLAQGAAQAVADAPTLFPRAPISPRHRNPARQRIDRSIIHWFTG